MIMDNFVPIFGPWFKEYVIMTLFHSYVQASFYIPTRSKKEKKSTQVRCYTSDMCDHLWSSTVFPGSQSRG